MTAPPASVIVAIADPSSRLDTDPSSRLDTEPPLSGGDPTGTRSAGTESAGAGSTSAEPALRPVITAPPAPPDPRVFAQNLARCVVEVLAGTRALEQLTRWLSDDVREHLLLRDSLARRARAARGESPARLALTMGSTVLSRPSEGIVDAVVIVHGRARSRAVALRLEAFGARWRATAVHVL